jgi:hypothetical protein
MFIFLLFSLCDTVSSSGFESSALTLSGSEPRLYFYQDPNIYDISLQSERLVINYQGNPVLQYEQGQDISLNVKSLKGRSLEVDGNISFDGIAQWRMIHSEDFTNPTNWSDNRNSECAGITMLGGYCLFSEGEISKKYTKLPAHSSIKISGTFHFIDAWAGETAYLKGSIGEKDSLEYLWAESYRAGQAASGTNICGGHHSEGRFSSPIEIIVPHEKENLEIVLGSTADQDPCALSWGISKLQLYIR